MNEIDNRGSAYFMALYWAKALADQSEDPEMATRFAPLAKALAEKQDLIQEELLAAQGSPVDIDGYYAPNRELTAKAMRPSKTFNDLIDGM